MTKNRVIERQEARSVKMGIWGFGDLKMNCNSYQLQVNLMLKKKVFYTNFAKKIPPAMEVVPPYKLLTLLKLFTLLTLLTLLTLHLLLSLLILLYCFMGFWVETGVDWTGVN